MTGVYFPNVKKPRNCDDCPINDCPVNGHIDGYSMNTHFPPTQCPAIWDVEIGIFNCGHCKYNIYSELKDKYICNKLKIEVPYADFSCSYAEQ